MDQLISCCGLDCEKCDARIATMTNDNALREKTAALWTTLNGVTITPEMINCTGCRVGGSKTPFCDKLCPVHNCVREKGLDTCADCGQIALHGGSFTKVCENADGSLLKAGKWIFTGDDIVQLSREENSVVLFTVSAHDADDTLLGEGAFLYDVTQEKLYVTISADDVTCSTSDEADAPADVPPAVKPLDCADS